MRSGSPKPPQVLERAYSAADAVPRAVNTSPDRMSSPRPSRLGIVRSNSAPQPSAPYEVPTPAALSPRPIAKHCEKLILTPPAQPNLTIEVLRPIDVHDPELILLSPVDMTQRRGSAFHLAVRFHDFIAHCEGNNALTELIAVKEVFEGTAPTSPVLEEAFLARAAKSEVGVDEVRLVDVEVDAGPPVRFGFGTMRLGGEMDVRRAMRYVPEAICRTPSLAASPRAAHGLVVLYLAKQVAQQLVVAHDKVAHLDLNPKNVFVSPEGVARVGDWGSAQTLGEKARDDGTHGFMPLEQYSHGSQIPTGPDTPVLANAKSDMWAFGILLLTALTGHNPFFSAYKLRCIRKLELYRVWERHGFGRNIAPQLATDNDRALLGEVYSGLSQLRKDFPAFAPLIGALLQSDAQARWGAEKALNELCEIERQLTSGPVDWPQFWMTLSTLYRTHDETALMQARSVAKLADAMDAVREMYLAEQQEDAPV